MPPKISTAEPPDKDKVSRLCVQDEGRLILWAYLYLEMSALYTSIYESCKTVPGFEYTNILEKLPLVVLPTIIANFNKPESTDGVAGNIALIFALVMAARL